MYALRVKQMLARPCGRRRKQKMRTKILAVFCCLCFFTLPGIVSLFTTQPLFETSFTIYKNHIVINATINDISGNYMFDTGCPLVITKHPINDLPDTEINLNDFFLNGEYSDYKVKYIEKFRIDNETISIPCAIIQSSNLIDPYYDGIIGLTAFRGNFLEISFSKKKLRVYREKPKNYKKNIPLQYEFGIYPVIQCNVDGLNVPFLVDTGADNNLLFPLPDSNTIPQEKYARILHTRNIPYYRVQSSYLDVNFEKYKNITGYANTINGITNYTELFQQWGNIGFDYLKRYDFVFDTRGSQKTLLYYKKASAFSHLFINNDFANWYLNGRANVQFNSFGIDRWDVQETTLIITAVIVDSPAFNNELLPGTRVSKINNKSITHYSKKELENVLLFSNKNLLLSIITDKGLPGFVWVMLELPHWAT